MSGWIKICGVRNVASALTVLAADADAIGLNFFAQSPRSVAVEEAATIVHKVRAAAHAQPIGVFVNHSFNDIERIVATVGCLAIQLHGDESPEFVRSVAERHPDWRVFKAFRVSDTLRSVADFVGECEHLKVRLAGCLLDAKVKGSFGGTGKVAPWELIAREYDKTNWPPLILAGGLTPDNVAEAIATVRPFGVDAASGVESSPEVKDTTLLARFVAEARRAFAEK